MRYQPPMARISITDTISIDEDELSESFVLASGPGGQNVNKVSSAVQLRFDVVHSPSLPDDIRTRLIALSGNRLTKDGVLVIVARAHRTQERNRADARAKLADLIMPRSHAAESRARPPSQRLPAKRRRLESKITRGRLKRNRGKVRED
jgi:ribosome-associated protein